MSSDEYVKQSDIEEATGLRLEDSDEKWQKRYQFALVVKLTNGSYRTVNERNAKGYYEEQIDVVGYDVDGKDMEIPRMHKFIWSLRGWSGQWVKLGQ